MDKKGQLAAWEALIILIMMGATAWMFYLYAHKPSEASIYQSGSKPNVTEVQVHSFGCASIAAEKWRENHDTNTNKVSH